MTASSCADLDSPPQNPRTAIEFARYFGCSAAALAADFGLFWLGMRLGLGYAPAAVVGFVAGLWLAYRLSIRYVFSSRRVSDERVEFMVFAAVGLAGLLLTELLLWLLVTRTGWPPMPAKLATAGAVFLFNFGARKGLLFTGAEKAVAP